MAEDRLKFRCYRCNQLLSTSPKRVGKEISCPRCKAELVVPEPDAEPEPVEASSPAAAAGRPGLAPRKRPREVSEGPAKVPQFLEDIAAAIPEDLVALRPEDIRVEAEFVDLVVTTTEPETPAPRPNVPLPVEAQPRPATTEKSSAEPSPREAPQLIVGPDADPGPSTVDAGHQVERFVDLVVTTTEPETPAPRPNFRAPGRGQASAHPAAETVPPSPRPRGSSSSVLGPDADPGPAAVDAGINAILPAITIEPPTILPPDREIRHVREVVLQPSTVLAWSLLVLLSIPMAFLSGLLIGHFLWK